MMRYLVGWFNVIQTVKWEFKYLDILRHLLTLFLEDLVQEEHFTSLLKITVWTKQTQLSSSLNYMNPIL